jgi:phage repressor protein C with HTH and peptisase S24 domain
MDIAIDVRDGHTLAMANHIRELRKARGLTMDALARRANTTASQINKLEKGERRLTDEWMHRLAEALDCSAASLMVERGGPTGARGPIDRSGPSLTIPEIDVRAGAGGGGLAKADVAPDGAGGTVATDELKGYWTFPEEYVRGELHVRPADAAIIEVRGDSMSPTLLPGDRIMVDTGDRNPSPPGVFAMWDGFGVVAKRIEIVPNTDPVAINVKSDNPHHDDYQRSIDEVSVIGRIVWVARRI